jgi:hypothetical protein
MGKVLFPDASRRHIYAMEMAWNLRIFHGNNLRMHTLFAEKNNLELFFYPKLNSLAPALRINFSFALTAFLIFAASSAS